MNYDNNISPEELERIERFLTGQMPPEEAREFEELLQNYPSLKEKTEEVKALLIGISEQSLANELNTFHKDISSGKVISLGRKLLVAASVLAVAFITVWWFAGRPGKAEDAYAKLYSPDPGLATVMGRSSEYDFDKAMVEYKNGEYDKAIEEWSQLLKNSPSSDTLIYFVGAAYQAKNDKRSVQYLEKIASDTSSVFYKDANWYLGLYYLKTGQKEKALANIERSGHAKSAEAIKAINEK